MLIEIGFVGINLVIGLLLDILDLAAESMVNRFELKLTVADPGWPVGATTVGELRLFRLLFLERLF